VKINDEYKLRNYLIEMNSFPKIKRLMLHGSDNYNYSSGAFCMACKNFRDNPWDSNECVCFQGFTFGECEFVSHVSLLDYQRFQYESSFKKNITSIEIVSDMYEINKKPKHFIFPIRVKKLHLESINIYFHEEGSVHLEELYIYDFIYLKFKFDATIINVNVLKMHKNLKKLHMATNGSVTKSAIEYMKNKGIVFTYNTDYVRAIEVSQQLQISKLNGLLDE
jgi:hypothetical protein